MTPAAMDEPVTTRKIDVVGHTDSCVCHFCVSMKEQMNRFEQRHPRGLA